MAAARRADGATTVAATSAVAAAAEIGVFATGGLGGVHREASVTFDESADLVTLARTPIVVVCAGVKSILDVGRDAGAAGDARRRGRRLRHPAVPGLLHHRRRLRRRLAARLARAGRRRHPGPAPTRASGAGALILANPLPVDEQLDPALHDRTLAEGLELLARDQVTGKAVTPFLLAHFHESTEGQSLAVNVRIILRNAALAARIAVASAGAGPAGLRRARRDLTVRCWSSATWSPTCWWCTTGRSQLGSDTAAAITVGGGGQAANTAAWLARAGRPVTLVAAVGDDAGGPGAGRRADRRRGALRGAGAPGRADRQRGGAGRRRTSAR